MQASKGLPMEKRLCWAALGVAGLLLIVFLIDLILDLPFGLRSVSPAVDVVVMNSDYQTGTLRNGFTYTAVVPAPTVTGISPPFGQSLVCEHMAADLWRPAIDSVHDLADLAGAARRLTEADRFGKVVLRVS